MAKNPKENVVLTSKVVRFILIYLDRKGDDYSYNIARGIMSTWSDVAKKIKILVQEGLIELVVYKGKEKRNKYHKLTEKGKRIVDLLLKLKIELGKGKANEE